MSTPTPAKKFMLLQDVRTMDLSAKAGTMGEVKGAGNNPQVWFDNGRFYFWLSQVKASPLWFREVEEPVVEKEIIGTGRVYSGRIEGIKEGFDAARELDFGGKIEGYMGRGIKYKTAADYISSLATHNSIGEDKKDWEIIAITHPMVGGNLNVEPGSEFKYVPGDTILTVRRLSDGEVFTIGDEVVFNYAGENRKFIIGDFNVEGVDLMVKQAGVYARHNLLYLSKEEKKEPFQWREPMIETYRHFRPNPLSQLSPMEQFKKLFPFNQSKQH